MFVIEEIMEKLKESREIAAEASEFKGESRETLQIREDNLLDAIHSVDREQLASTKKREQSEDIALLVTFDVFPQFFDQFRASEQAINGDQFLVCGAVEFSDSSFGGVDRQYVAQVQEELVEQQRVSLAFAQLVLASSFCWFFFRFPDVFIPIKKVCQCCKGFIMNISR